VFTDDAVDVHAKQCLDLTIPSLFNIRGQVAVVTGGGSGLGTMITAALVQNGAKPLKEVCVIASGLGE
jgi:hypothetical protein